MPAYEGKNNLVTSCENNVWLRLKLTSCMVLSHENTSMIAQLIPVLYKQRLRHCRLPNNFSECLLTTLYDNVDRMHHTMSTNRTEEKCLTESVASLYLS